MPRQRERVNLTIHPEIWNEFKRVADTYGVSASVLIEKMMAVIIVAEDKLLLSPEQVEKIDAAQQKKPQYGLFGAMLHALQYDALAIMNYLATVMESDDVSVYMPRKKDIPDTTQDSEQ